MLVCMYVCMCIWMYVCPHVLWRQNVRRPITITFMNKTHIQMTVYKQWLEMEGEGELPIQNELQNIVLKFIFESI